MDFTAMILKVLGGALFDVHTYVGIAVGAVTAPLWVAVYNYVKTVVLQKIPAALGLITKLEESVDKLEDKAEVVTDIVEAETARKAAKTKKK